MHGVTGHSLIFRNLKHVVRAPENMVKVEFPQKTIVRSAALLDSFGRPVYRKDVHV